MIIEIKSNYLILSPVRPLINTFLIWTDQITKDAKYKINNKKKKDKKKKKSVKIFDWTPPSSLFWPKCY